MRRCDIIVSSNHTANRSSCLPSHLQPCAKPLRFPPHDLSDFAVTMSKEYEGQDPLAIAKQAERDLNSHGAKHGHNDGQSGTTIVTLCDISSLTHM